MPVTFTPNTSTPPDLGRVRDLPTGTLFRAMDSRFPASVHLRTESGTVVIKSGSRSEGNTSMPTFLQQRVSEILGSLRTDDVTVSIRR